MKKEIPYQGYTADTSDYESLDGQLAASINLLNEDGHVKPLFNPKVLHTMNVNIRLAYIHKTSNYEHYIFIVSNNSVRWADPSQLPEDRAIQASDLTHIDSQYVFRDIISINSIGNTLLILTKSGMQYVLWKSDATPAPKYIRLGDQLPEITMSFGLKGSAQVGSEFTVDLSTGDTYMPNSHTTKINFGIQSIREVTDQVLAKVNAFVAEKSTNAGKFLYPFFVRYAYRLYDGSTLTMHSSPILMHTNTKLCIPQVFTYDITSDGNTHIASFKAKVGAYTFDLDCQCVAGQSDLEDWSDVVQSVDIFISAPMYSYKQSGEVYSMNIYNSDQRYGYSVSSIGDSGGLEKYAKRKISPIAYDSNLWELDLPSYTWDEVNNEISSCGIFYYLKSYLPSELPTSNRTVVDIPSGHLETLVNQERMTDDYDSHDKLIPQFSYVYNARLNIANIQKQLALPTTVADYVPYTDNPTTPTYYMYVFIKQDGKKFSQQNTLTSVLGDEYPLSYFYYPNPNAYMAIIYYEEEVDDTTQRMLYQLPLTRHNTLNGAVYNGGLGSFMEPIVAPTGNNQNNPAAELNELIDGNSDPVVAVSAVSASEYLPNKVYTSEVNNPFFFPLSGIKTIGTGTIIGMASATQALSQGQFGEFPMYIFADDGVWALQVENDGTFAPAKSVTRDVCVNQESITQTDNAVLFATQNGILLLAGSQARCISDVINSEHPFDITSNLPQASALLSMLDIDDAGCLPVLPFLAFLEGCRMVYDYIHQRVVVFNPTLSSNQPVYKYAYVYSIKSGMWGLIASHLMSTVNSYPDALAMEHYIYDDQSEENKLSTFSEEPSPSATSKALLITRPFKLDAPDVLKSIRTIMQRGYFQQGDVKTVLYGSRDLNTWRLIGSSVDHTLRGLQGTPYKYFRIASVTELTESKSLVGATVEFTIKEARKIH